MPVYAIYAPEIRAVKIGYSETWEGIDKRLACCQTGCPAHLSILARLNGELKDEAFVHNQLLPLHIRGEWFIAATELVALLARLDAMEDSGNAMPWQGIMRGYTPRKEQWKIVVKEYVQRQDNERVAVAVTSMGPNRALGLRYTDPQDGRRKIKTAKTRDWNEAELFAQSLEERLNEQRK